MAASTYQDLLPHVGHVIHCVTYGDDDNVAVECGTCGVVLMSFDKTQTESFSALIKGLGDKIEEALSKN